MSNKPTVGKYLDDDEQDLIESIESNDAVFQSVLTPKRKKAIESMARATINDDREKISLRIPRSDLVRIKSRALQEGIPYQTLINSILHKELTK